MIRSGEHYTVETLGQFLNRTDFTHQDVLEAIEESDHFETDDVIAEMTDYVGDEEWFADVESVQDLPDDVAWEEVGARNLSGDPHAIEATLEADDGEWVHIFDGHVHDIVELYPEDSG